MSRKVIYRAWDKKYNVMLEGFGISAEGDHIGLSYDDSKKYYTEVQLEDDMGGHFGSGDDWTYILNDFELMEFTGLTDKNVKRIYEGDIYEKWGNKYVIEFYAGAFCANQQGTNDPMPLNWENDKVDNFSNEIEIIGNIWENKDLLKES